MSSSEIVGARMFPKSQCSECCFRLSRFKEQEECELILEEGH